MFLLSILIAALIDILVGWPDRLYKTIGHPVTWMAVPINFFDRQLNREKNKPTFKKVCGVLTIFIVVSLVTLIGYQIQLFLSEGASKVIFIGILCWPFLAIRSMYEHVYNVYKELKENNLDQAREKVSMIVGRDTSQMDEQEIVRSCIESLAENTSDGIIAPLFWGLLLGLPGIIFYKAVNTFDSMIGYKTQKYREFGWASARLDDLVNIIPSRLTCILFSLASKKTFYVLTVSFQSAKKHRSPNAGWPETAMAVALNIKLSGPRKYNNRVSNEPWLNPKGTPGKTLDILKALNIYKISVGIFLLVLLASEIAYIIFVSLTRQGL